MADTTEEDEGRSVAVWLLIGIAAIFALLFVAVVGSAVVGSFVIGLGENVEESPTTSFGLVTEDGVAVVHSGGDSIDADELLVTRNGEELGTWASLSGGSVEEVTPGDEVAVPSASDGDVIGVVWTGGDERVTLTELEVEST